MAQEKDFLSVRESFVPPGQHVRTKRVFVAGKKRKGNESLMGLFCAWVVKHQIGISLNLLTLLGLVHIIFPRARRRTRKFFEMQYYDEATGLYGRGFDDIYLVTLWVTLFTGLRVAVMEYLLQPLARVGGIASARARLRFAEQGWYLLFYLVFWTMGMQIMYNSPYWLNLKNMWNRNPVPVLESKIKFYYIVQFACWLHQLFVVNVEERRKDHWQMFTHHIFTSILLLTSYGWYQTSVGNVILCIMDVVDILLPLAKMLNYLQYRNACDAAFGLFLVVWFFARHVFYMIVCYSIATDLPATLMYGCYDSVTGNQVSNDGGSAVLANVLQPFNDPNGLVCFNANIKNWFLGLLLGLQVLTIIWFGMILKVAYMVLSGKNAQEPRSDDEASEEEEEYSSEDEVDAKTPLPTTRPVKPTTQILAAVKNGTQTTESDATIVEVGDAKSSKISVSRPSSPATSGSGSRTRRTRATARTSAISIPGHADRKELLGRIGCDKPS